MFIVKAMILSKIPEIPRIGFQKPFQHFQKPSLPELDLETQPFHLNHNPTSAAIALTIGGTLVSASVMMPKRLMLRLLSAAARGSLTRRRAVAIAEEFPPNVTPLVT